MNLRWFTDFIVLPTVSVAYLLLMAGAIKIGHRIISWLLESLP